MLLFTLDEGGTFEYRFAKSNDKCGIIGGAIFICADEKAAWNERYRLGRLFEGACKAENASFPYDLHYNHENGVCVNPDAATRVKNRLSAGLHDFLTGGGEWKTDKPHGKYLLFATVGDSKGMGTKASGNIMDDNNAALRYERMLYRTIENALFYNPRLPDDNDLHLELPTRVIESGKVDGAIKYGKLHGNKDSAMSEITNAASFRAAVELITEKHAATDAQLSLMAYSISYDGKHPDQHFLYLADTLNSVYQDAVHGCASSAEALRKLRDVCGGLVGAANTCLWAYNPIDNTLRGIMDAFRRGEWFEGLIALNNTRQDRGLISQEYTAQWLNLLDSRARVPGSGLTRQQCAQEELSLRVALEKLHNYTHSENMTVAQAALDTISARYAALPAGNSPEQLRFRLHVTQMAIHNHSGEYDKALDEYQKCLENSAYVDVEEFLGMQLMQSVAFSDGGRFDEALDTAQEMVTNHELLMDIRREIYHKPDSAAVSYGRALSQLGQCHAFRGSYDEAIDCFEKALASFGSSEADIRRTQGYLMHAYIEAGMAQEYAALAQRFFDGIAPSAMFRFDLYIYLKGMYVFGGETLRAAEAQALISACERNYRNNPAGHPWEMVFKYLALLLLRTGAKDKAEASRALMDKAAESVANSKDGILPRIISDGEAMYKAALEGKNALEASGLSYMYR